MKKSCDDIADDAKTKDFDNDIQEISKKYMSNVEKLREGI